MKSCAQFKSIMSEIVSMILFEHVCITLSNTMVINYSKMCPFFYILLKKTNYMCSFCILKAIDSIHQVGLYCLALVPANTLPKTPLGGIHICETKQSFLDGNLHPCNILMCPHTCVTNMPKPRQKQPGEPSWALS